MSRANTSHSAESIGRQAGLFRLVADEFDAAAKRMLSVTGAKSIGIAHQATVDKGLLAARKQIRELSAKLDDIEDQRNLVK
jgi:hypothetical protein